MNELGVRKCGIEGVHPRGKGRILRQEMFLPAMKELMPLKAFFIKIHDAFFFRRCHSRVEIGKGNTF